MILRLLRFASMSDATIGAFSIDGRFSCFSLEDEARAVKIPGETRIPAGTYAIKLQAAGRLHAKYAERFHVEHRGMLTLQNVPNFTGVMIHVGNLTEHTDGCLLLGDTAFSSGALSGSTSAYRRVYGQVSNALLAGEPVSITIEDA